MSVRVEFKPRDLWIGAYWRRIDKRTKRYYGWQPVEERYPSSVEGTVYYDVWICLVPMLPIHVFWQNDGPWSRWTR